MNSVIKEEKSKKANSKMKNLLTWMISTSIVPLAPKNLRISAILIAIYQVVSFLFVFPIDSFFYIIKSVGSSCRPICYAPWIGARRRDELCTEC